MENRLITIMRLNGSRGSDEAVCASGECKPMEIVDGTKIKHARRQSAAIDMNW